MTLVKIYISRIITHLGKNIFNIGKQSRSYCDLLEKVNAYFLGALFWCMKTKVCQQLLTRIAAQNSASI